MTGFFSRMFDPPRRPGFFGGDLALGSGSDQDAGADGSSSADDATDPPQWRRNFFSLDPNDLLFPLPAQSGVFGSLAPNFSGAALGRDSAILPLLANFGVLGVPRSEWTDPNDWPWRGEPDVDPRMPFFVLPPNTVFNMPVYKWKWAPPPPIPPWVDKEGHPHLDGWNPEYNGVVGPGREI